MSEVNSEYGTVQWFDQKKGYGFVKILKPDSEYFEKEVFVHYTSIQAENSFKKLYPGLPTFSLLSPLINPFPTGVFSLGASSKILFL